MVNDSTRNAALALHRFGLGPRPGTIAAIASDPRGALLAELERPGIGRIDNPELVTSAQAARAAFEARAARQAQQIVAQRAQKEAERLKADSQKMGDDAGQSAATSAPPAQGQARCRPGRRDRICRAPRLVLVEPFLRVRGKGAQHGGRL
jgi:uncharacterized protein (DUF1800 family)